MNTMYNPDLIQMKECISITRDSVTQTRTLLEESSLPGELARPPGSHKILVRVRAPDLVGQQHEVNHSWSSVTPVDKPVFVIA